MSYALAVAACLFASLGQVCLKIFAVKVRTPTLASFFNIHLAFGVPLFITSAILGIIALRVLDFSVYYSVTVLNYLFISAFSKKLLKEEIDKRKIIGNLMIIAGLIVYSLQSL